MSKELNAHQAEAVANADAHLSNASLPTYSEAMALLRDIEHVRDTLYDFRPDLVVRLRAIVK